MAKKPSAVDGGVWTANQAMLAPGQLRVVDPIHDNFDAISDWIDTVTTGDTNIASDKTTLANLGAVLAEATTPAPTITAGDTVSQALRKLEWMAKYQTKDAKYLTDASIEFEKLENFASVFQGNTGNVKTDNTDLKDNESRGRDASYKAPSSSTWYTSAKGETLLIIGVAQAETASTDDIDRRLFGALEFRTYGNATYNRFGWADAYIAAPSGGGKWYGGSLIGTLKTTAGTKYQFNTYIEAYGGDFTATQTGIARIINLGG